VGTLKVLLVSSFVLAGVCLALAVYHYVRVRRDARGRGEGMVSPTPLWGVFPQPYTARGRRHQRLFYAFFAVFVVLCVVLLAGGGPF
jgi:hypothetical protein